MTFSLTQLHQETKLYGLHDRKYVVKSVKIIVPRSLFGYQNIIFKLTAFDWLYLIQ